VKTILFGIMALFILSFSVHAGSEPESEEEIAARNVWHAAKLRGVAFRAIGQEPGWLLEMTTGEKFLLVTDTGQTRTEYPYVEPEVFQDQRKSVFSVNQDELKVTIEGVNCTDIMSGEKFEVSVFIEFNGKKLKGCGRALY
jgi:putative lipoprotein